MNSSYEGLIETKCQDLKYGDVFYLIDYAGKLVGPYLCTGFRINQRTRKLPYTAIIVITYHPSGVSIANVISMDMTTKRQNTHWLNSNFLVDPNAAIMVTGLAVGEPQNNDSDDIPF